MSHAAPEGRKFPPRLIPIINEKNSGTDEKAKPSLDTGAINVVIIGIKINAVGVFATTPEIKLIIISIIKDKIKGFNSSNAIIPKISPNPATLRHPTTTYNEMKKNKISHSTSLKRWPIVFPV